MGLLSKSSLLRMLACLLAMVLTVDMIMAMPPKRKQPIKPLFSTEDPPKLEPASSSVSTASSRHGFEAGVRTSNQAELAKQLILKARHWNWRNFNWTALYIFFHGNIGFSQYLEATQSGGWQAIENLAGLLVSDNTEIGMYQVFSALHTYHQYLEAPVEEDDDSYLAHENNPLLIQLNADYSSLDVQTQFQPFAIAPLRLGGELIVHIMSTLDDSFSSNMNFMGITMANSLSDILTVLNSQEGITLVNIESIPSSTLRQKPTLASVMLHVQTDSRQQALALLIGHPFEQETIEGASVIGMQPETNVHQQAAQVLQRLWGGNPDQAFRDQLAQLAILCFHYNFLLADQQVSVSTGPSGGAALITLAATATATDWSIIEQIGCSTGISTCFAETNAHYVVRKNMTDILRAMSASMDTLTMIGNELAAARFITRFEMTYGMPLSTQASKLLSTVMSRIQASSKSGEQLVVFLKILLKYNETNEIAQKILRLLQPRQLGAAIGGMRMNLGHTL